MHRYLSVWGSFIVVPTLFALIITLPRMRLLWTTVAIVIGFVAALPNVVEYEIDEIVNAVNFIETKEQLIDFITEGVSTI